MVKDIQDQCEKVVYSTFAESGTMRMGLRRGTIQTNGDVAVPAKQGISKPGNSDLSYNTDYS